MSRAIVLLSGGLDSATALAMAKSAGFEVYALSFRYGQRHILEVEAARRVASSLGVVQHAIADIDLRIFGGSALTGDLAVPKGRPTGEANVGIPVTYVPARNTIFLSFALAWAEVIGADAVFIGVNAVDYSGYPDCRPEYIRAYQALADLATKAAVEGRRRVEIRTPLMEMGKTEIIARGLALGVDYGLTRSCYDPSPDGNGCGACDSCRIRLLAFSCLGLADPAPYRGRG